MKAGDLLDLTIEKAVYRGLGLARHEGQVVLVPRAAPGERLRVRVEALRRGYATAGVEEVLEATRRPSPCALFPRCGGCAYQHLEPAAQLETKVAVLRDALGRAGVPWEGEVPARPSPEEGWRTRAALHLEWSAGGALRVGLHEERSHSVVDAAPRCLQLSARMNEAQRGLAAALAGPHRWTGRVSGMELAESGDGRELVAVLVTDLPPAEAVALRAAARELPWLTGLCVEALDRGRRRLLLLEGRPYVEHEVAGLRLRAHARSFFQANRFLVGDLAQAVAAATPADGAVVDLHAGVGLFTLATAPRATSVRGVELNPYAIEDAALNVRRAGLSHVRIDHGDALAVLRSWAPSEGETVVLDPPRTGAPADLLRTIAARGPAVVVYVSCDPPTLARDLALLAREGYRPESFRLFDMFPDTFHLEVLVRLVRAGGQAVTPETSS